MSKGKPGGIPPKKTDNALELPGEKVVNTKSKIIAVGPTIHHDNPELANRTKKTMLAVEARVYNQAQILHKKLEGRLKLFGDPKDLARLAQYNFLKTIEKPGYKKEFYFGVYKILEVFPKTDGQRPEKIKDLLFKIEPVDILGEIDQQIATHFKADQKALYYRIFANNKTKGPYNLKDYILGQAFESGLEGIKIIHRNGVEVIYKFN